MRSNARTCMFSCAIVIGLVLYARANSAEPSAEVADLALRDGKLPHGGLCVFAAPTSSAGLKVLAEGSGLYVQGLTSDRATAERFRIELESHAANQRLSVVWRRTEHLPYLDSLINLFIAEGWNQGELAGMQLSEIARVLCPGGIAVIGSDKNLDANALLAEAGKLKLVKAEAMKRKGAWVKITKLMNPDFGEWTSSTGSAEMHNVSSDKAFGVPFREVRWLGGPTWANCRNAVYAGGRSFHLEVAWISTSRSQVKLVARDAFNGCELWRENVEGGGGLCADDHRVYCVDGKELVGRDAITGKIVKHYGPPGLTNRGLVVTSLDDCLIYSSTAVDKETTKVRWSRRSSVQAAGSNGTAFVYDGTSVEAVSVADGKSLWRVEYKELSTPKSSFRAAIYCKGETVYLQRDSLEKPGHVLTALDRSTGAMRWSREYEGTILPYNDAVLQVSCVDLKGNPGPKWTEIDLKTGKDLRSVQAAGATGARCWAPTATERFTTSISESIYFDRQKFEMITVGRGIRSNCGIGSAFAYGLMFSLPHACNCGTVLRGVSAVSPPSEIPARKGEAPAALVSITSADSAEIPANPADWPLYRGGVSRSGGYAAELPAQLKLVWSVQVGRGALAQATGANGVIYVAEPDTHRVFALDLASGENRWTFVAEGRVYQSPTLYNGICFIADHSGWVYAVNAASGKVAWMFQAAPEQQLMCAFGQPESSWPVRSGVVVVNGTVCISAGRTGITDGGIKVYGLDPLTGQQRWKREFTQLMPNDLLVSNGTDLVLERVKMNPKDGTDARLQRGWDAQILKSNGYEQGASNSLLDLLGVCDPASIWLRKSNAGNSKGAGQAVAFDKDRTIGTARIATPPKFPLTEAQIFSAGASTWNVKTLGHQMLGLVLAGERIYAAGIPEYRDSSDKPALWILSSADGKELQRLPIDHPPGIDTLSALGGKLILTSTDGYISCFGAP